MTIEGLKGLTIKHTEVTVTTSDTAVIAADATETRKVAWVQNIGSNDVYLKHTPDENGATVAAVANEGILLAASGGVYEFAAGTWTTFQGLQGITGTGSSVVLVCEGV